MSEHKHLVGLTDAEVLASRTKHGANVLTPKESVPLWKRFLEKFSDPLIIILLVAGAMSIAISCYDFLSLGEPATVFFEPVGIFIAILLATGLSFYFELRADKEFNLLNQVNDDEPVQVIRNGNHTNVPKKDIVVGDVVILTTGDEVPADAELIESVSLSIDESTLTGEPSCSKTTNPDDFDKDATFPSNHVMRGTKVMDGHAVCKVFAVGDNTENGKVFEAAQIDDSVKTPLNEQLDGLGLLITKVSYGIAALIVVGRVCVFLWPVFFGGASFEWVAFTDHLLKTLMIAVALIVVAVPEGLPMAVTLSLAYSMRSMLKTNNLVRKMHACETMGATTVICTDKTGTLTQNRMQIYKTNFYGLADQKLTDDDNGKILVEGIAVNSSAQLDLTDPQKPSVLGNPTEGALLLWLRANGYDYSKLKEAASVVEELPFSSMRKYMATVVKSATGKRVMYVKGAPEIVYGLCKQFAGGVTKQQIDDQLLAYQQQAMRTLGFAYQVLNDGDKTIADSAVVAENLTFLGIVAISDPVRADVPDAVKECIEAGIKVKIVTGDTPGTAKEIGRQIGLWQDSDTDENITTGPEFAALTDEERQKAVEKLKIISRARPLDKDKLVRALQANNHVVAVTGDGTNDAPALHAAHVGLSMGDGTSVAKEASDITIVDNSFSSIGRAVMWGRSLYQNIQRFILFQMTVNVAACLIVLAGAFMGTQSPLTVTQMLWVNLIMDTFAAMALASLPPTHKVMHERPRDREAFIISKPMWKSIIGVGGFFFVLLLGLVWMFDSYDIPSMTNIFDFNVGEGENVGKFTPYELSMFFTIFVMLQFWNLFNARAFLTGKSAFNLKDCSGFITIVLVIFIGQIAIVSLGGQFFNVTPLAVIDWVIIIAATSLVLWVGEIARAISRK